MNLYYGEFKQHVTQLVDSEIDKTCQSLNLVAPLGDAVRYSLFPAGKRIRPLLALCCCQDLGGTIQSLVRPSCALELVHASSLIHDDLPALDNDDFRRGQPSCHRQFGEATAILAGDLLIAAAFSLVADSGDRTPALTTALAQAFVDVCHGQQRDLLHGPERGSLDLLHRLKTGALFRAAMIFGASFADISPETVKRISVFGETLGIYFQIIDDLIDLKGNEEQKGRPSGSDHRNQRETWGTGVTAEELAEKRRIMKLDTESQISEIEELSRRAMPLVRAVFAQVDSTVG